jgi:hypothetical protein
MPKFACSGAAGTISPQPGNNVAAAVPGATPRAAYESVGGRTSLVSLNGLTLAVAGMGYLPWAGLA